MIVSESGLPSIGTGSKSRGRLRRGGTAVNIPSAIKCRWSAARFSSSVGGYRGLLMDWVAHHFKFVLTVVLRSDKCGEFKVLPKRWVVERTFAWLGHNRRLSKDYEVFPQTSETFIYLAMTRLMLRRIQPG
jgi:hypothetical protein